MSLIDEQFERLAPLAFTAARAAQKRYPSSQASDLQQVAFEWCVTHPGKLRSYLEDDDERRGTRMLVASMRNYAKKYARAERAAIYGYDLDDEQFYSKRMLKGDGNKPGLLHYVFDEANWTKPPPSDGAGRGKGDPAEGGTWLTMMVDLDNAIQKLSDSERQLLEAHYFGRLTYDQCAATIFNGSVAKTTVAKYVDRAVAKIQDHLGGPKPREDEPEDGWDALEPEYVGTRRVISNAHARAITDNQ